MLPKSTHEVTSAHAAGGEVEHEALLFIDRRGNVGAVEEEKRCHRSVGNALVAVDERMPLRKRQRFPWVRRVARAIVDHAAVGQTAMKLRLKLGVIAGGYIAAFLIACAAVGIRLASTSGPDAQASSGMYAFGDALLFLAVFVVVALVPTGAALFLLRLYHHLWVMLSACGLGVAVTGLAAAFLFAVGRHVAAPSPLATWAGLSVLRILVAPLFALAFLVCAALSPYRIPRLAFLAVTATEAAVSAYGGLVWFVPLVFPRP